VRILEHLGVEFESKNIRFERRVEDLRIYKEKYGHCNVTRKNNKTLHLWLYKVRKDYKLFIAGKKCHILTEERVNVLEELGVEFGPFEKLQAITGDFGAKRDGNVRRTTNQPRKVEVLDMNNNRLHLFESCSEASRVMNVNRTRISRVCYGDGGELFNKIYRYVEDSSNEESMLLVPTISTTTIAQEEKSMIRHIVTDY
jgi:hypothetical protein